MTSKVCLVAYPGSQCHADWQRPYWQNHFDVVTYDPKNIPKHAKTLVVVNYTDIDKVKNIDLPVVVDHLFDSSPNDPCSIENGKFVLRSSEWMWINEQWGGLDCDYNQKRHNDQPTKFFLMPLNLLRPHRNNLVDALRQYLDHSVWSYVEKGRMLPDDVKVSTGYNDGTANDRLYLPHWYSSTCFSVVSETTVSGSFWISEKTFKPLAYQHPFVIQGHAKTLDYVRNLGFETFETVFAEDYDKVISPGARLRAMADVVDTLYQEFDSQGHVLQDTRTKDIVNHNYDLFWNQEKVNTLFKQQVVDKIYEFAESL